MAGESPDHSLRIGLELAERAVQLDEAEPQCHYILAVALGLSGQIDRALAEGRRSVALAPNLAQGHHTIARTLTFSGDPAGAINTLEGYMRLDPLYPDMALHFLAEARVSLGQFDEAITALKQRLERSPDSATSLALLASCYGNLERMDDARAAWAQVMKIAPDFSIERQKRILPYKNPADFERRIEGLRKANIPL
jgi:adenylate cyclase